MLLCFPHPAGEVFGKWQPSAHGGGPCILANLPVFDSIAVAVSAMVTVILAVPLSGIASWPP